MAIGTDPRRRRKYVLRDDRGKPEAEQTWFWIITPSQDAQARMRDTAVSMRDASADRKIHAQILLSLRAGLDGVDQGHPLRSPSGEAIAFERGTDGALVSDAFLDRLRWEDKDELAVAVLSDGIETEDLEKSAPSQGAT